jgi:hypothetical protein
LNPVQDMIEPPLAQFGSFAAVQEATFTTAGGVPWVGVKRDGNVRIDEPRPPTVTCARQARPDVPVIRITAYGDAETRRKAADAGAAGLFTKPIDFPELRGEIGRRVDHTKAVQFDFK